jgi:uncharacterized cysteine cluster protein YcgN (CxxCxxCC family)
MSKSSESRPFWKTKTLTQMSRKEWESLCDGCARCCLHKYEDDQTGAIWYTDVSCHLLDLGSCRCSDYKHRTKKVADCISLTPQMMPSMTCLPPTCAYRLVYEGKDLPWWHHLVSGSRETVHMAKISVKGRCISEEGLSEDDIEGRMVQWPLSKKTASGSKERFQLKEKLMDDQLKD